MFSIQVTIDVGKKHDINLEPGNPNAAAGHCLYESFMDNINNRSCFTQELSNTPEHYRMVWNREGEMKVKLSNYYPANYTEEEWRSAWEQIQTSNVWDLDYFGDMAIISCAHSLRKDVLIFNTNHAFANEPISVISADQFDPTNQRDTEVPVVLASNGNHFESLIPKTIEDIQKTVKLVKDYKTGKYVIPRELKNQYKKKELLNAENTNEKVQEKTKKPQKDLDAEKSSSGHAKNEWKTINRNKNNTMKEDLSSQNLEKPRKKIKDTTPEEKRENYRQEEKYPEFVPTFEFQELQNWQRVPIGCITEINLKTGKKYCKLDPKKLKDPNYGIPACLRKKSPKVTPSDKKTVDETSTKKSRKDLDGENKKPQKDLDAEKSSSGNTKKEDLSRQNLKNPKKKIKDMTPE